MNIHMFINVSIHQFIINNNNTQILLFGDSYYCFLGDS